MSNINNNATLPPPQHPASGTTAAGTTPGASAHQVNDGSAGAQSANAIGEKVKAGWNVFHGAGEGIRGNVNSMLDNFGEQIAGRGQGDVKPATRTETQQPAQVAAQGADEFREGAAALRK